MPHSIFFSAFSRFALVCLLVLLHLFRYFLLDRRLQIRVLNQLHEGLYNIPSSHCRLPRILDELVTNLAILLPDVGMINLGYELDLRALKRVIVREV